MRKPFLVVSLALMMSLGGNTFIKAQTVQAVSDDKVVINLTNNPNIDTVVKNYFVSNLESIKQGKPVDLLKENISDGFKDYNQLNNKYFAEWYKKVGKSLYKYSIDIKKTNMRVEDNKYYIDSTVKTELTFKDSLDTNQIAVDNYSIVISDANGKFKLEDVVLEENSADTTVNYLAKNNSSDISNRYKNLAAKYSNIDADSNLIKSIKTGDKRSGILAASKGISTLASGGQYDFLAAVSYAQKWANSYNPAYRNWGSSADCTNFVSQCVVAGGKYMVEPTWAYSSATQSRSWTVVDDFRTAMLNLGYGTAYSSSTYKGHVGRGDILQFHNASLGVWHHSAIITKMDSYGTIYYSAHSNFRLDYGLYNVYPGSTYDDIRFISIY